MRGVVNPCPQCGGRRGRLTTQLCAECKRIAQVRRVAANRLMRAAGDDPLLQAALAGAEMLARFYDA